MLDLVRQLLAERAGRAQAAREIEHLASGYFTSAELSEHPIARLQEAGGRTPYARAYAGRWFDEGYRDAMADRARSMTFKNADYDFGWIDGMRKRRNQGYRHEALDSEFGRLVRLREPSDLFG